MSQRSWRSLRLYVPIAVFSKEGTKPCSGSPAVRAQFSSLPPITRNSVFRAAEYLTSSWHREEEESSEKMSARATSL